MMAICAAAVLISLTSGAAPAHAADDPAAAAIENEPAKSTGKSESEGKTIKTKSGLEITEIRAGTGERPNPRSKVTIHYHGTLEDGTVFDSSVERGKPATFPLPRLIRCWQEGIPMMREGGKSRLVCPPKIAYGARGAPPRIPKNATLTFEVELFEIVK